VKSCVICGVEFAKPSSASRKTWEKRKCCSYKCSVEIRRGRPNPKAGYWKGRKQSPEARAKRSESLKRAHAEGRMHVIDTAGLRGAETSQWKGDDIGYRAAHIRVRNYYGEATDCELCGTTEGPFEWALDHEAENIKVEQAGRFKGRKFSPDVGSYFSACLKCHREYDGGSLRDLITGRFLKRPNGN
jgi:hypothetical protein